MSMYSIMEDNSNKIYIELLKVLQLPPKLIQHAKVSAGGMQFSLLVGVSRWMYEESYMKACMGMADDTTSAVFQAFNCSVIQLICKAFPGTSDCVEGTPQVVDVDEECVEGLVPYHYGNTLTKGTERINRSKHYQSTITFHLTAVKKKSLNAKNTTIFGYIDGSDLDSEEMNDSDEQE